MSLEISDSCPECGYNNMQLLDSDNEIIPSGDYDLPPDSKFIWLKEYCPECGFEQTKEPYSPDPDSEKGGIENKRLRNEW